MTRRPAQLAGLAAVLLGFALLAVDVSPLSVLGQYSYVVVLLFGFGVLGLGWLELADRRTTTGEWWRPAPTESGYRVSVPGDELADLPTAELKDRLRRRVVVSLMAVRNCSEADAKTQVEDGTWTDDRLAAAYLGSAEVRVSPGTWLRMAVRRTSLEEHALDHTVAALRDLRRGESR